MSFLEGSEKVFPLKYYLFYDSKDYVVKNILIFNNIDQLIASYRINKFASGEAASKMFAEHIKGIDSKPTKASEKTVYDFVKSGNL